jgi:hypothetical protein
VSRATRDTSRARVSCCAEPAPVRTLSRTSADEEDRRRPVDTLPSAPRAWARTSSTCAEPRASTPLLSSAPWRPSALESHNSRPPPIRAMPAARAPPRAEKVEPEVCTEHCWQSRPRTSPWEEVAVTPTRVSTAEPDSRRAWVWAVPS